MRTTLPEILVLTQPNCGACKFVEKAIDAAGLDATYRDVRQDESAAEMLVQLLTQHRPGERPRTPVTVIDGEVFVGPGVRDHLRAMTRAAA
ncbi:glutaredoxin family protein [Gordonia sp. 1D]|uniref:glutaredoxin family protein n=1 Tax=Gordonia sp. 1D TaxID=1737359 RepID=UPI0012FD7131|nr:glutaredoxin family protein [Gordonia sp. 1D]